MSMYKSHRQPPAAWVEWLDGWSLDMQSRGLSDKTVESYWYRVTNLARFVGSPPGQVSAPQIQAWIIQASDATTRAGRRAAANEFYKWAMRFNLAERNPVDKCPPVKRPRKLARQPAPEQAVAAGVYCADPEARIMVMLAAEAGLRREEISRVKGADVIEYAATAGAHSFALTVHGKGNRSRVVPIGADLAAEIRARAGDGWLFPGRYDGHCCVDHVLRVVKRATGYPTHAFRRRYGRTAYEVSDHDLRAVQTLLGHESPATTQSYVYVPESDLQHIAAEVVGHRPAAD